ncbi:DNA topoisomerase [Weissella oryzae SG25]|uniref:DNA topoisomerase n=2 Tax=Weissella TaxID=46255 RepID=A0A069D2D9_WEIOS|nr:DNA topoisomerase [Weissella oryzae SG25]
MIYERQMAIKEFIPQPFSELVANVHTNEGDFKAKMDPTTKFNDENKLAEFMQKHSLSYDSQQAKVINVNQTEKKTESPRLFSLSALQSKANKMFKASASDTLNAVQSLYEKKFLTYPRTDTQFITENEFKYLNEQYLDYLGALNFDAAKFYSEPRKRYVDGKKVQEHHAIIPTRTIPSEAQRAKFSALESQIYWLVLKNTMAMFLADFTYDETIVTVGISNVNFKAVGKVITGNGWKEIFGDEPNNNNEAAILPNVTTGQAVNATLNAENKMTTPPEFYTEGTLITAMKRAGRELSDDEKEILSQTEGIGTEATRAGIIDRLKDKKYIVVEKNKLKVTTQGIVLCEAVKMQPLLTSPELTAKWELALSDIGHGNRTQDEFLANIHKLVNKLVQEVPGQIAEGTTLNNAIQTQASEQAAEKKKLLIGKCPVCKTGNVIDRKTFYGCSNYKSEIPCKFSIAKKIAGKTITKAIAEQLIENGQTKELKGFESKAGKEFSASLKLVNFILEFSFSK